MKSFVPSVIAVALAGGTAFAAGNVHYHTHYHVYKNTDSSSANYASVTDTPNPIFGWATTFDASDVAANLSNYNLNLTLLKQQDAMTAKTGGKPPFAQRPIIGLSGEIAVDASYGNAYNQKKYTFDNTLGTAFLMANIHASDWVNGTIEFGLDPDGSANGQDPNNIGVSQAFVTVGNLSKTPWYASAGRMYLPFGRYAGYTISDPSTEVFARQKETPIMLGYAKGSFNAQGYVYKGNYKLKASSETNTIDGGVNFNFNKMLKNNATLELGTGYTFNIFDSVGLSNTYGGSAATVATTGLGKRVGAYDVHARYTTKHFDMMAEFIQTLQSINTNYVAGFGTGKPHLAATDVQVAYLTNLKGAPTQLGLDWTNANQALSRALLSNLANSTPSVLLPQNQYSAFVDTSIWKNTVWKFQYSYQQFNKEHYAVSGGAPSNTLTTTANKNANVFETEFDLYF